MSKQFMAFNPFQDQDKQNQEEIGNYEQIILKMPRSKSCHRVILNDGKGYRNKKICRPLKIRRKYFKRESKSCTSLNRKSKPNPKGFVIRQDDKNKDKRFQFDKNINNIIRKEALVFRL